MAKRSPSFGEISEAKRMRRDWNSVMLSDIAPEVKSDKISVEIPAADQPREALEETQESEEEETEESEEEGAEEAEEEEAEEQENHEEEDEYQEQEEVEQHWASNNHRHTARFRMARASRDTMYRKLNIQHPKLRTMWNKLEKMPVIELKEAPQPPGISRLLKPFQRQGLHWMKEMEKTKWKGGLLGDEMGLGKTIQAVSLIMSDFPSNKPSLVLVPPVALMQWVSEIESYTNGKLRTFVYHNSRAEARNATVESLRGYDVIMMSYNSLESMYRRQVSGTKRKLKKNEEPETTPSPIHQIDFHRVILDEAHEIKTRTTSTAKACFALKTTYRWCLSGTPLQNRIGELFSLLRFINVEPFASYFCIDCNCESLEWSMDSAKRCTKCSCRSMAHVSIFNQELLNPIQKHGNEGPGEEAFRKLGILTERLMLRRQKKDHMDAMELPVKEMRVSREFFGAAEQDLANSIMNNSQRKFDTYVSRGVLLNNYANIFGLIMQMRQVADHPDLILRRKGGTAEDGMIECAICEQPAEDAIRSDCNHHYCRSCVTDLVTSSPECQCVRCHIPLAIDLEQEGIVQDPALLKNSSIVNRISMENWTSSTKIEMLLHELYMLRSDSQTVKVIIFSQFTSMLQLVEWRLRHAGFTTVMLDGSMTPAQRAASIKHFMENVDVECFLVSLKAGGVALNLTEASRVFLIEPWWNPAVEWQSADRCHRIGQCRPCTITNLVIEDSVESRMVMLQEKKARMIRSTINHDKEAMQALTPQDLMFLFRGN
ncbi:hypothetical protein TD95_003566 [Thielaviopsis punctulata]|uniref:DNA repair protein RAD16 n=1 Tax=Thielaviopsis punctulata TaxID=72032 RepID=A0A0F4ZB95_9PEZI|nr:hypothetical protein TD95_003566 [Thielaviopsis punctulata]